MLSGRIYFKTRVNTRVKFSEQLWQTDHDFCDFCCDFVQQNNKKTKERDYFTSEQTVVNCMWYIMPTMLQLEYDHCRGTRMWSEKIKYVVCATSPVHKAACWEESMPSHTHPTTPCTNAPTQCPFPQVHTHAGSQWLSLVGGVRRER